MNVLLKVIQCGRHNDIFKLWLQWRARGNIGFEKQQDRLMELTYYQVINTMITIILILI